ncbi:MAG: hypothetical protein GWM90_25690, partial [Gemmatimonadetes bacterium]|nr:hypothetical protein [Gemmatimonadota bacterium]NIQ58221.1 hypothetical protein [Gemmatimonadota bacterium]NIU78431.1 hypothetical protein [Gammaproteobacteria bacterium]NIX47346.1 hypothetical protein [Gemmatimonadota bacterium]
EEWETTRPLLRLAYDDAPAIAMPPIPETLRPIVPLDTLDADTTRVFVLTQGFINGKKM